MGVVAPSDIFGQEDYNGQHDPDDPDDFFKMLGCRDRRGERPI